MIKAYDYFGFIDLGAEEDDTVAPYDSCPICVHAVSPADSEFIYESLCLKCTKIIHTVYAHPHHPLCQSVYIPVAHDSIQVLALIKMRLYNMIESSANTKYSDLIEIIKDLMEQTPVDFTLLSLINAFLFPLLATERFGRHSLTFMIHVAVAHDYINLETSQSLNRRVDNLNLNMGV